MTQLSSKKILGLITARGGSKGIPGKNIKELAGKPLIAYTIKVAQKSGVFDRIILSTDCPMIAHIAKKYGCEVPFLRPDELATDTTPHNPVLRHAITWLQEHENYMPDLVIILQPTAPLRTAVHIREAIAIFGKSDADSVVSLTEIPSHYHPRWQFMVSEDNCATTFTGEPFSQIMYQRQGLSKTYMRNGAIYLLKTKYILDPAKENFYGERVIAYIIKPEESVNIDTIEDWKEAERRLTVEN